MNPPPPSPSPLPPPAGSIAYSNSPCRLPVAAITEASGSFLRFPGGAISAAPGSAVALPGQQPGQIGVNPGLAFDRPLNKWVPVPVSWLTPSGRRYAYEDFNNGQSYVVDVAAGVQEKLSAPPGWYLFGVSDDGAYIAAATGGAWFFAFNGAAGIQVAPGTYWGRYDRGRLWGLSGRTLLRYDLASGQQAAIANLSAWNDFLGFDIQGSALVLSSSDVPSPNRRQLYTFEAVTPDGHVTRLWSGAGYRVEGTAIGDVHGIWFIVGSSDGIPNHSALYRWTPRTGARAIVGLDGNSAANIAGTCA